MAAGDIKIPGKSIDDAGTDLLIPLVALLTGINALGPSGAGDSTGGAFSYPPQSVAIIEAGATALTKWWSTAVAAVGGATAITSAATGFWNSQPGGTRIALVGATGAILAAVAIALAIIVSSDVRGRALGATAIYDARARVAERFLEVAYHASATAPAPVGAAAAIVPAAQANLDALVGAAVQHSVDPLTATLASVAGTVNAIDKSVSGLNKTTALITLGARQGIPNAPPVQVTSTDGLTGTLIGVFCGPTGDGSGNAVHLNVEDQLKVQHSVQPENIDRF